MSEEFPLDKLTLYLSRALKKEQTINSDTNATDTQQRKREEEEEEEEKKDPDSDMKPIHTSEMLSFQLIQNEEKAVFRFVRDMKAAFPRLTDLELFDWPRFLVSSRPFGAFQLLRCFRATSYALYRALTHIHNNSEHTLLGIIQCDELSMQYIRLVKIYQHRTLVDKGVIYASKKQANEASANAVAITQFFRVYSPSKIAATRTDHQLIDTAPIPMEVNDVLMHRDRTQQWDNKVFFLYIVAQATGDATIKPEIIAATIVAPLFKEDWISALPGAAGLSLKMVIHDLATTRKETIEGLLQRIVSDVDDECCFAQAIVANMVAIHHSSGLSLEGKMEGRTHITQQNAKAYAEMKNWVVRYV